MKAPADKVPTGGQSAFRTGSSAHAATGFALGQHRPLQVLLFFLARLILGGVFIFASLDKLIHPLAFAESLSDYQILPDGFINLTAIILPWLELILGSLLALGLWLPGAIVLLDLLLVAFFGALVFNLLRGLNVDCGCFSSSPTGNPSTLWYLIRDIGFLLLGGYLCYVLLIKPSTPLNHESCAENDELSGKSSLSCRV
jgi:uncharacterized membrane protein YphA (DoxX/SURF4 family)